jgi:hypothetical protein
MAAPPVAAADVGGDVATETTTISAVATATRMVPVTRPLTVRPVVPVPHVRVELMAGLEGSG